MDNHHHEDPKAKSPASKEFVPPRHWIGPQELQESYWNDPKVQEKRAQEFYEKPIEFIDKLDRTDKEGIARRDFLTVMGASMAMSTFACARRPVHKIIPYVIKPEEITPGVPTWYASTADCGCGVLVKNREGRPIKLEGNPDHPINQGALCTHGQASVLNLYDPDRLTSPVARSRGDGSRREVSWADADRDIETKLKKIAGAAGRVRLLSGEISGISSKRLISEFLAGFKQSGHVQYEPLSLGELSESQELSYGTSVTPRYRFDKADVVVSFGADFLGNWLSPIEHTRDWSKLRRLDNQNPATAKLSKFYCFESMMTMTGASADERYPVRPGDEAKIALALAHELIVVQKKSSFAQDSVVTNSLANYSANKIAAEIGLKDGAAVIKRIAEQLWDARGKSLIVGGSIQTKTRSALALQLVINLLNSALSNEGVTVDGVQDSSAPQSSYAGLAHLIADMKAGKVDALIVYRSNPAYTLPRNFLGLEDAFKQVPLVIAISDREDETALWADYVLPDHHYLENWGDASPRKGLHSLQQPTLSPIHSTRAFQDTLLTWMKATGLGTQELASQSADWHAYLQNNWKVSLYKDSGVLGTFDQFWEGALRSGVYSTHKGESKVSARSFKTASLAKLGQVGGPALGTVSLVLYPKAALGDGRSGNNAWLQELPDPISSITWDNYLNVGPALAAKWNVGDDDVVQINVGDVSAQLPVHIQPGLHGEVVAAAIGYGRRAVGKVGNQAGVDVNPFIQVDNDQLVYSGQPITVKKTGKFYKLASTQWHTASENRPIINDITLTQFRKNPAAANHTDPHLRLETVPSLWPVHEYKGYRWGMAIDLTSCTGCGACVIACQAENNIPVVGRTQVRVSRQMHWLKIDRYYSGPLESPNVLFQPMLCQHCENAPCETVCPVAATVHDDEGLNVQVYNRCVGTRYCQNNCPYKVRRFNFFDHWKSYEGTMNMVWNPDVSVRTRGVMEKCTFCTQRIREAKDKAKDAGERVRDGDVKPACQQTCSANAIIFGDMNDPKSMVSRMKESPQAFRVLEVLNAKPSISYMTKVRNQVETAHSSEEEEHA